MYLYLRPRVHRVSDKVPKKINGGVLIAANHTSMLDPLILFTVFWYRRLYFPATKELFRKKINRFFFKNMNCILIDKNNFNSAAVRTMCEYLNENKAIAIFPEGAINLSDELMNYKLGTVFMAKRSGKPVLPVYISGRDKWWRPIHVCIGEPVDVAALCKEFPKREALVKVSEYLRDRELFLEKYCRDIVSRNEKKKRNVTAVYVAEINDDVDVYDVYPTERQDEIDRCSCDRVRREKYCVWKLLEYALNDAFGLDIRNVNFYKNENGKWLSDKCFFSLSHTDGAVAVAVSDKNVGVDIEAVRRHREGIEQRILTNSERAEKNALTEEEQIEYIIKCWSKKESIFKTLDLRVFEPNKIESSDHPVNTRIIELGAEKYALSVCTEQPIDNARFYIGVSTAKTKQIDPIGG